jgi:hypothetical protein
LDYGYIHSITKLDNRTPAHYPDIVNLSPSKDGNMSVRLTPPLSPEGIEEVLAEMRRPPADTPERRATFRRARSTRFLVEQVMAATPGFSYP